MKRLHEVGEDLDLQGEKPEKKCKLLIAKLNLRLNSMYRIQLQGIRD